MADRVDTGGSLAPNASVAPVATPPAQALPRAREIPGEHTIARVLRMGALLAGLMFVASLIAESFPASAMQAYTVDLLRKGGMTLLIVTPVGRLIAAGVALGIKGEWRYAAFSACILLLLAVAITAGFAA